VKTIALTTRAAKELDALPGQARTTVDNALILYATQGIGDIKKLHGIDGYRLRVGEYRVIFAEDQVTILAVQIGRRSTTTYRR
jgi:mRNA interferase RelE/StbE